MVGFQNLNAVTEINFGAQSYVYNFEAPVLEWNRLESLKAEGNV